MNKLLIGLLLTAAVSGASAQGHDKFMNGSHVHSDYMTGKLYSGWVPTTKFEPSSEARDLSYKTLTNRDQAFVQKSNEYFDDSSYNIALIMLDHGEIVNERYSREADKATKLYSWSMAKSLTAMTVGEAVCSGKIKSLDDTAETYSDSLKGTQFGRATIRQLLTMTSGALPPGPNDGGSYGDEWMNLSRGWKNLDTLYKQYGTVTNNEGQFEYINFNTTALALVVDNNKPNGFKQLFESTVWKRSGASNQASWMTDDTGKINAAVGFSATLHDWAKLGNESLNMRNGRRGKCLEAFMTAATTKQATNNDVAVKGISSYGYQTWVDDRTNKGIYFWIGAFGQKASFSPKDETVLITFRNKFVPETAVKQSILFRQWNNSPQLEQFRSQTAAVQR